MTYRTDKLYYDFPYHRRALTAWRPVGPRVVAVARSIAYPEGGGQLADRGTISQGEQQIRFVHCLKTVGAGRVIIKPDFPVLNVDGEVHLVLEEDVPADFDQNREILVEIDAERRAALTVSHSASHLVYLAMTELRSDVPAQTRGCLIEPDGGRFDVSVEKYTPEEVEAMVQAVRRMRELDQEVRIDTVFDEPECRVWKMGSAAIACGGIHVSRSGLVPEVRVTRNSKGKILQRVYFELAPLDNDHELLEKLRSNEEIV